MLTSLIVRVVAFCVRHAWGVILAAVVLSPASGVCAVRHFAIDTKIDNLMSPSLDWRKREITYHNEFPQSIQLILVVVDGPTPELAGAPPAGARASDRSPRGLVQALSLGLRGVEQGQIPLDAMARTLNMAAEPIEKIKAGQTADFP